MALAQRLAGIGVVKDRSTLDCCTCEHCRNDIIAYALNLLPQKYVVSDKGAVYSKITMVGAQHSSDIMAALTNGKNRRKPSFHRAFDGFLASLRGFEPPAYRLGGGRSIQLSYSGICKNKRPRP